MDSIVREGRTILKCDGVHLSELTSCTREPVSCGSMLRLQHLQTRLFLHSHNFRSPLSNNQEVSCFGDGTQGDEGA